MAVRKFGAGQSVKRVEDIRLVTGQGRYASDACEEARLKAAFVRSPYGHARFTVDDLETAKEMPGVRAVFTAKDLAGLGGLSCLAPVKNGDDTTTPLKPYPLMADSEAFQELVRDEFPEQAASWPNSLSRRHFLALMGASLGLAGLSGCSVRPAPSVTLVPRPRAITEGRLPRVTRRSRAELAVVAGALVVAVAALAALAWVWLS